MHPYLFAHRMRDRDNGNSLLHAKTKKKVKNKKLARILPNFNCDIARTMFNYMLDIIPEDIEKNELKSYMLIEE